MNINLEKIWKNIWMNADSNEKQADKIWLEIQKAYSSKGRYYHNLSHIVEILQTINQYMPDIEDIKTLQLAVFFHDMVYSSKRKDNEERSADLAVKKLKLLNYPHDLTEKCRRYILATKDHLNTLGNKDLNYFLDSDLQKLGTPWPEYLAYTLQIRKEYRIYPDLIYIPGRRKVLEHFLNQEKIYKTKEFTDLYELSARQNISKELEMLK